MRHLTRRLSARVAFASPAVAAPQERRRAASRVFVGRSGRGHVEEEQC
jgi:hypothetical protein